MKNKIKYVYVIISLFILLAVYYLDNPFLYKCIILSGALYWLIGIAFVIFYQKQRNLLPQNATILMFVGLLLLVPMWSSLVILKSNTETGPVLIMLLMLLIWGADTAAYFVGKKWGKRKLANYVSPGKTWEGTIAGILASIVIATCYIVVLHGSFDESLLFIVLSVLTVIGSIFGDLMESMVKREARQKDSGTILPGHGGIMDRIDSLTAAAPIFVCSLMLTGQV